MPLADSPSPRLHQYLQVAEQLRRQIQKGILKPGDRLPTMREMRERHGVNFATMEKAHAVLAEEGLIVREQRRGAFVAEPRQRTRTGLVGICGLDFDRSTSSPYWSPILAGARDVLRRHDLQIMLLDSDSRSGWEKIDGFLYNTAWAYGHLRYIPEMLPHVFLLMPPSAMGAEITAPESGVLYDNYNGLKLATEHLLGLGHTRIAYLHSHNTRYYLPLRMAGYHDALRAAGITPDERWVRRMQWPIPQYDFASVGSQDMRDWLAEDWFELGCTALLVHNDSTAFGAIEALREAGLEVPRDVSVVGFDGIDAAELFRPKLTTVEIPLYQIGETAMELLLSQIESEDVTPQVVNVPVTLRSRESSGPPPGG